MILLPDIRLGENVLSIQEPFTLNGYLVVDINMIELVMSYHATPSGRIVIKNENNYYVELRLDELDYHFNSEMNYFISRYGNDACVEGRRDISNWSGYSFSIYINEIEEQCRRIYDVRYYSLSYSSNNYLNALKADLRRQGREYCEYNRVNYSILLDRLNIFNSNFTLSTDGIVRYNNTTIQQTPKYIHSYNYKPEYIHHYMLDENQDTTLLLGAEIEVAGNEKEPNREDVVKKCIQIINGSEDDTENLIYSTSDSTVQIELDTMPCSLEFHKNKMNYKELFKYLDELGYKGHDCDKAGLHIHANRSYLGKSELVQQLTISKILYIIEKFNDEICVIARRNNSYSQFVGKEEVNKSLNKLYNKYHNTGKKVALNLQHEATIEFRMFRSTLKYETFILTLEFVKNIIDFAKSINIEQIETMKWTDLTNTFSDELKEYYNERLEKENRKKQGIIEETKENNNTTWRFINGVELSPWLSSVDTTLRDITDELRNYSINTNSTTSKEESLKDKIKSLKKKIKNSNNFMEKKNLEKELNEAQKELKKEKRKKKLNNNTDSVTSR